MNEPIRYSAGIVTAYGAAVRGGYQGTYEQWCQDMANLGDNVAEVRQKAAQVEQTAQDFTEQTVPAAIQSVADAGADQVQAVEAAGTDVEADIDAAKTTAISALQTESATQQAAIQQKGEGTIASIPSDYTELSDEVDDLKSALTIPVNYLLGKDVFPFDWEAGSFYSTTVGQALEKYDGGDYLSTRKRAYTSISLRDLYVHTTDGYKINVLRISNGVIISRSNYIEEAALYKGREYALLLKADDDSDISSISVDEMLSVSFEEEKIDVLNSFVNLENDVELKYTRYFHGAIKSDDGRGTTVAAYNDYDYTGFIDVSTVKRIKYTRITSTATGKVIGMAFYADADAETYLSGEAILGGQSAYSYIDEIIDVPQNAKYARFTMWNGSENFHVWGINEIVSELNNMNESINSITHEIPESEGVLNCIKRARQLSDVKWTPMMRIPRDSMMNNSTEHWLDWFNAETEYTGFPYSGGGEDDTNFGDPAPIKSTCDAGKWGYRHMFIGLGVPIEAFITASRYPNSILGERVNQSAWSFDSSLYGTVCSALVTYAFDLPGGNVHRTANGFCENWDGKYTKITDSVATMNIELVKLCDVFEHPTHVALITDLIRDKTGNIEYIEVTEATTVGNGSNNGQVGSQLGGRARRKFWTIAEIKERYGAYKLWRFNDFSGIQYVKNPFVTVGNEAYMEPVIDYPCIPYLGSGAKYKVGYIYNSKVLIGATGFTELVVLKDGVEFGTFAIDNNTEYVDVGFSELGEYEAYLKRNTVTTMHCHWSVIEDNGM